MADNNKGGRITIAGEEQGDSMFVPQGIKLLFENLSVEIKSSQNSLSKRIDNLEKDLECKIIEKITDLVSSLIKTEVNKLRDEYNSVIDTLNSKVATLEASFADIVKNSGSVPDPVTALEERKKRFIIKHLSEDNDESSQTTLDKVNALIKDGYKLSDVTVYKKVYIENDYSQEIRTCDSNFRTILKEMGKDKQFRVAGGKVYPVKSKAE